MSATKVKIYKNSSRNDTVVHKPYIPQYQVMGIEPSEYKNPVMSPAHTPKISPGSTDNPRATRPHMRSQPYAEAIPSPIGRGKGTIPNVGNNMERTWSGVDGDLGADISEELDPNHPMIDNNEFVSVNTLGIVDDMDEYEEVDDMDEYEEVDDYSDKTIGNYEKTAVNTKTKFLTESVLQDALHEEYLSKVIKQLEEDEYCLLVEGTAICSGPSEYIEEQTRALVFGEHELYASNQVSVDDIIVIKRAKVKIGVFLE